MVLNSNYFKYNATGDVFNSADYGIRFMWVDESPESVMTGNKSYVYAKNNANDTFSVIGSSFKEPESFNIELISDTVLTDDEVNVIYRKLFNRQQFADMEVYEYTPYVYESGSETLYSLGSPEEVNGHYVCGYSAVPQESLVVGETYYKRHVKTIRCIFANPQKIEYGQEHGFGIVGFMSTLVLGAPYIYGDDISSSYEGDVETSENVTKMSFNVFVESGIQGYVYPDVEITLPAFTSQISDANGNSYSSVKLYVTNTSDAVYNSQSAVSANGTYVPENRYITIMKDTARGNSEVIKYLPEIGSITSTVYSNNSGSHSAISRSNKRFLRLLPGNNNIEVYFAVTANDGSVLYNLDAFESMLNGTQIKISYKECKVLT